VHHVPVWEKVHQRLFDLGIPVSFAAQGECLASKVMIDVFGSLRQPQITHEAGLSLGTG
jgi:hypothetical protein